MKTIQINNINFDIHNGPVGIALSGGADSSIMLYVMMLHCPGPIHVYTCANKLKQRINPKISLDIIGKLLDITGREDVYHHIYFVERQTLESLFSSLHNALKAEQVSIIYTAGTAMPPDVILRDTTIFSSENGLYEKRNPNITKPVYNGTTNQFYSPWWNVNKKFVKQVYDDLQMTNILYPITRSCEDPKLINGHCGKCWWCEERLWAFGRLS